jgi:DNA-binding NarL/FixJ family response regulator
VTPLKARILLADDHAVVRRGLRLVLEMQPDLGVVAEAGDGIEAVQKALAEEVDLAILDITMPRLTGLHAVRELRRHRPALRVLMLSMHENERYLYEALKVGASGDVLKTGGRPRPGRSLPGRAARREIPLPGSDDAADRRAAPQRRSRSASP